MKTPNPKSVKSQSRVMVLASLLLTCWLTFPAGGQTNQTCINVTKNCDTVVVGSPNTISGVVSNCGNVTLTNITIVDNLYGSVATFASLAPGASQAYTRLVTNTCGSLTNVVTASGRGVNGTPVQAQSTATCVATENPCISVTKTCDAVLVGQANLVTAVVTNCGNVPLHGITVVDNIYGSVGTIALLAPGGTATLTKSVTNTCGNFTNTVTATGLSPCNTSVQAQSTALCAVTENPCIGVTKTCNTVLSGQANLVTAVVTNCGSVPLHGITVTDNIYGSVGTIALLAPGGTATLTKSVTNTCGNFTNTVTAVGLSPCNTSVANTSTATCVVRCGPKICVTKEVACELPTGCGSFADLATGTKSADNSQCPSFCYRVRVTNCGVEALNNVTVVDNVLSLAACNFPTSLAVGQTVECIIAGVQHCENVTNTVTAAGVGASSGIGVSTNDSAAVVILPIDITCNLTVNGQSSTSIRCDGQAHVITNAVEICNTGALPLTGIAIQAPDLVALGGDCTNFVNLRLSLLPGECTNVLLCTEIVTCLPTNGVCAYTNHPTVTVTGVVDASNSVACSWTRNPSNQVVAVTASSSCSATVVIVVDITPPRAACIPGVNPSAKKIPVAGKNPSSGQNPDGYYQLLAKDDCDPNPVIYVADTGSSFIAGPFASGDVIKLTQSPGKTPSQYPAPDPIVAHLHFKGDAALYAVDANGNVSEACLCLVPRPPK